MKNNLKLIILFTFSIILLTGCNKKESNIMKCSKEENLGNGVTLKANYNVSYDGLYVTKLETKEVLTSKNQGLLENYKNNFEQINKNFNNIDYYEYKTTIQNNKLISEVNINYEKVDINELIKANPTQGQIFTNGKLRVSDVKSQYEDSGIKCVMK